MRPIFLMLAFAFITGCDHSPTNSAVHNKMAPADEDGPDLFTVSEHVFARYSTLGYGKLNPPEQVFQCIWGFEAELNNGGFDQFYFNNPGNHAADTVKALDAIGAKHTAQLVRQANAIFGPAGPPTDPSARQEQLDALGDEKSEQLNDLTNEFYKYNDNLEQLLRAYVVQNEKAFISAGGG